MTDKPDDRIKPVEQQSEAPEIFAIIDGKKVMKPGLETFFVDPNQVKNKDRTVYQGGCTCNPVVYPYCSCFKITVCKCVGHQTCSCVDHTSSGGGYSTGCRCAPVH